jgi:GAF domain-containing protein
LCALLSVRLEVAVGLSQLAAGNRSFLDLCREMLQFFRTAVPCEAGSLFEVCNAESSLFVRTAFGQGAEQISSFRVPIGQGIVGHVAESKSPMLLSGDVGRSRIYIKQIADAVGFDTRSVLVVPILIRGRVFSVIELLNRIGSPGFDRRDLETAMILARVSSAVLEGRLVLAYAMAMDSDSRQPSAARAA